MAKPSDFVSVQLSAAGIAFGAGSPVRIATMHFSYTFTAGTPVRVLTSEWTKSLSQERVKGETIFEIAPTVASADDKKLAAPQQQKAAPEAQIAQEGK